MAIAFARVRYVSRSAGDNAVRSAAYNARTSIRCARTNETFSFRHRAPPEYHALLLPGDADPRFGEIGTLWNAAEIAERRKDSQVARELVLALPADAEVTPEDRIALARSYAEEHFVSQGLAVQLDIHAPDEHRATRDPANWHAHLLVTTRRLGRDGFAATKARDLDPDVRALGGWRCVVDGEAWGETWQAHQDRFFRAQGSPTRVDLTGLIGQLHVGPRRMRRAGSDLGARAEIVRLANHEAALDPALVLDRLTRGNATFTARELEQFLSKQLGDDEREVAAVRAAVLASPDLVALYEHDTGGAAGRFTTREVREQERAAIAAAGDLAGRDGGAATPQSARAPAASRALRPDQAAAFAYATAAGHLKLIQGRAGTGKSYTLSAIRDAHARAGKRVIGLAPTHAVAQDMASDGFAEAGTVHSALFNLKNGRTVWDRDTVVMVDEAAMIGAAITGELLEAARGAGAKLILVGDDRQLPSIERGGLFTELLGRHRSAEITEVTRQQVDWQRQAARDLAEYRFDAAVNAFERAGAISWSGSQDEARAALVDGWKRDRAADPHESRFVFAYTNRDVDALNDALRQVRRDQGELTGADVSLTTTRDDPQAEGGKRTRQAMFAVGDRVQFTKTDRGLGIYNGNVATITSLDPATGEITATVDARGPGREVGWNAQTFQGFRHGYAGTIYKGQGKTLDRTYLYHTRHWHAAPSYVALTRQRKRAALFVARETAQDAGQLARQMAHDDVRSASLAWALRDEAARPEAADHGARAPVPRQDAGPSGAAAAPDLAAGRARFQENYAAHRRERQQRANDAQARGLIRTWDQLVAQYRAALPERDRDPAAAERVIARSRDREPVITAAEAHDVKYSIGHGLPTLKVDGAGHAFVDVPTPSAQSTGRLPSERSANSVTPELTRVPGVPEDDADCLTHKIREDQLAERQDKRVEERGCDRSPDRNRLARRGG